ncbi:MAG: 30S ribosomal protein S12 methylthiotransferase RimO [Actinobacteria bacterium]|nr:30S ribosomal protein S12 methylthiotransferase RimO [Actinomycetota bacterium]
MTPGTAPPTIVYVHTLGCPKNDADSRALSRRLASAGVLTAEDPSMATHILLNTCGFIREAKEESIAAILAACSSYGGDRVVVTGCLVERYVEELRAGIPEVAGWFKLSEIERLVAALQGEKVRGGSPASRGASKIRLEGAAAQAHAYIKISDGCDELCTFCAIPAIKGGYYSLDPAQIMAEADACLAAGARELVLVGQDSAVWSYGDLGLTDLVRLLAEDGRVARIRLMYLQPEHVTGHLLEYMASQPKLCRYLDVPFQHAHPEVLHRMGRWGTAGDYLALLALARHLMPDVSVRSTFIVGFPGETEEQFDALLDFAASAQFDHAGGFVYSPEEGTSAERLRPRVRRSMARERLNRLREVLDAQAESRNRQLVGSIVEVLLDSTAREDLEEGIAAVGRTGRQAPEVDGVTFVMGDLPEGVTTGNLIRVRVSDVIGYDLVGTYDKA